MKFFSSAIVVGKPFSTMLLSLIEHRFISASSLPMFTKLLEAGTELGVAAEGIKVVAEMLPAFSND